MTAPSIAHLLTRTVEHWRPSTTSDGMGGQQITWTLLGTVAARRSQPTQSTERTDADAGGADITDIFYLLPDAAVRRGDELRDSGEVFEVEAVYQPSVPVYLRADARSRQAEV